ncbi:hypothetical protein C900_00039 [Fulvivirga imtechensis AK7]|uniref:DUF2383 domain-containing protein n=1 Tax=Fulvivirga imtechensis AK7 TaxID=1237149 RepID=L8JYK8_9BACT|nr:PA2169 family four-helix-bundle protein [Fulvivirga imtechensis]ELR73875.1 hypothetical protein C900_00039 [Fulvivirga imtechensis AK7]
MEAKVASEIKEIFEVLNERIKGYEKAFNNAEAPEIKSIFEKYMLQSISFEEELRPFSTKRPEDAGTRVVGDVWRFWMDIKKALSANTDEAMINASITGEEAAIDKYQHVLRDPDLSSNLRERLEQQLIELRGAHGNLCRLRDLVKESH